MPLFLRIFLGFWLVTAAVLGSWLLAGEYLDSLFTEAEDRHGPGGPPRFVVRLFYDLQHQPLSALEEVVQTVEQQHAVRIYLLDNAGRELLSRRLPPAVEEITARLDRGGRRAFLRTERYHLVAHRLHREDIGRLQVVLRFTPSRSWLARTLGSHLWLRLLVALLVSGLLCFALSRLLTRRLEHLRRAAGELAAGHLDTRLAVRQRGGDETDQLARDFNSMAEQLQQRIDAERQLLSDVSHELRSPLARLQVALALAERQPGQAGAQLPRLEREVQRLEALIDELLQSQRRQVALEEHLDLRALLGDICADARFEGSQRDCRVICDTGETEALVVGDSDLLRRAFDNLLRNALTYSPRGSTIRVSLRCVSPSQARIQVEDQGPGVPEADLERIFAPFYRVDSARTRETGGNGLGLAIARRAIEAHGGTLGAKNTGTGLCLIVDLPLSPD
ncbi:MAG: hypothetical protein CME38_08140 [Haliea sp.]|nr:hypothetical protein [Haliea sp.]